MMPKKTKKILIIMSVIIIFCICIGILIYLYYETNTFKSNNELFYEYLFKSSDIISDFEDLDALSEEKQLLKNNKYTSNLEATIKYTR